MNGMLVILVAAVALVCGYVLYGRWLAKSWGVDPKALTPARRMEDDKDFSPASRFSVFSHQFSSICGAGPVTGTIVAMMFGWLPVLLWVLVGGIFFGAVHDFGALYASVKNNGKSLGQLIEKYIGKTGRRLFLLFSWLFCTIVIAAFTSMVAGTFAMTTTTAGAVNTAKSYASGCAGTISILFTFVAIAFGWLRRRFDLKGWQEFVVAVAAIVLMFAVGMQFPSANGWIAVVMVYLVFACAMPIQTLKQPRELPHHHHDGHHDRLRGLRHLRARRRGQGDHDRPDGRVQRHHGKKLAANGQYLFLMFVSVACGASPASTAWCPPAPPQAGL